MKGFEHEHVTKYFYKNAKKFKIKNVKNTKDIKKLKYSIDSKKDLQKILSKINKFEFNNFKLKYEN